MSLPNENEMRSVGLRTLEEIKYRKYMDLAIELVRLHNDSGDFWYPANKDAGEESWVHRALCAQMVREGKASPDDWFPERRTARNPRDMAAAFEACGVCPVQRECLKSGIETSAEGIWGGRRKGERIRAYRLESSRNNNKGEK